MKPRFLSGLARLEPLRDTVRVATDALAAMRAARRSLDGPAPPGLHVITLATKTPPVKPAS